MLFGGTPGLEAISLPIARIKVSAGIFGISRQELASRDDRRFFFAGADIVQTGALSSSFDDNIEAEAAGTSADKGALG